MEEEPTSGVVTRLRRRLSTDPEESISPATPTKKKNSRLAVKPQLENIDELATVSPRRSKRSVVKETAEAIDDIPSTPSRRNSRTRSLTTNISMYQGCESPRAKRAARRHSQTGSDNEVSITPRSRRTRKNSLTSLESQDENYINKVVKVDIIKEELDGQKLNESNKELNFSVIESSVPKIRRSPRLSAKKNIHDTNLDNASIEDGKLSINIENENKGDHDHLNTETELCSNNEALDGDTDAKENLNISKNASFSDSILVSNVDNKPTIKHASRKNKSLSFDKDIKTNRNRSKSFSNLSKNGLEAENIFFSDNEKRRKNVLKNHEKLLECDNFDRKLSNIHKKECENHETNLSLDNKKHNAKNENPVDFSVKSKRNSAFIEDFDSDLHRITTNTKRNSITEMDDQCVPVVDQHLNNENKQDSNLSSSNKEIIVFVQEKETSDDCEPMDVDETLSENVTLIGDKTKEIENLNISEQNKSMSKLNHSGSCNNSSKSSTTEGVLDMHDIQANEYSVSSRNSNSVAKFESLDIPNSQSNKDENQRNPDTTLVADTPLKQKLIKKPGITTSTPVNVSSSPKIHKKDNETLISKPKTASESNDTSSEASDRNEFLDDEAEDAGVAYESGDSRDDEERCYEDDHEILEEGVTLTSESNVSDDSDYEKDSFLVSSDEQDYELLSGSGDDLGHSDNELTMTVQSKTKYNKRKMKETKRVSREMYQARHNTKTDDDDDMKKENKKRAPLLKYSESTDESESEQLQIKSKTKKSGRLDSSSENSSCISKEDARASKILKDYDDTIIDEKELTMEYNKNETLSKDPLSRSTVVKEELKSFSNETSMSTINFTTLENMAEVDVEQDTSILQTDTAKDPLNESDNDSGSSISENELVVQGYENMLNNLNEVYPTQQVKTKNISLDLETKKCSEEEKSINDSLNLTVSKSPTKTLINKSDKNIEDKIEVDDEANNSMTSDKKERKKSSIVTGNNKKKKKKLSIDNVVIDGTNTKDGRLEAHCDPIENLDVSDTYLGEAESSKSECIDVKEKKRKEKKKHAVDNTKNIRAEVDASNNSSDVTTKNTSNSVNETESTEENYTEKTEKSVKKKKKKHSMDNVENIVSEGNAIKVLESNKFFVDKNTSNSPNKTELSEDNHMDSTEQSPKKKKKKLLAEDNENAMAEINSTKLLTPNKTSDETAKENTSNISVRETESSEDNYMNMTKDSVKKKKKKHLADAIDNKLAEDATNVLHSNTSFGMTRKGNISKSAEETETSDNNHIDITEESVKKKRKKHYTKNIETTVAEVNAVDILTSKDLSSLRTKENNSNISVKETDSSEDNVPDIDLIKKDKKKKKKQFENANNEDSEIEIKSMLGAEKNTDSNRRDAFTDLIEDNIPPVGATMNNIKKKKKQKSGDTENIVTEEKLIAAHILDPKLPYEVSSDDNNKQFTDEQVKKKNKKKRDNVDNLPTLSIQQSISNESLVSEVEDLHILKKSKRKHSKNSDNLTDEIEPDEINPICEELDLYSENKKRKFSNSSTPSCNELDGLKIIAKQNTIPRTRDPKEKQNTLKSLAVSQSSLMPVDNVNEDYSKIKDSLQKINKKSKKIKRMEDNEKDADHKNEDVASDTLMKKLKQFTRITENAVNSEHATKRTKKRKMRDEDDLTDMTSVKNSENIFSHLTVPRLPATVIQQLEEKPLSKAPRITECPTAISTSSFHVEKTKSYKAKPSQYLEQSIRIKSPSPKPKKKKLKLIDIAPAPSSSICGFTTTFKVNVIPKETQFVAQSLNMANFKREQLYKKNIKRQGVSAVRRATSAASTDARRSPCVMSWN
ncbi:hypothetical protein EVAR_26605_1 [Eumeta japonica]|uniref:Protein slender lobes n=1 Tax=Eumeta variegata TaxID=151549 RepID=A0A4C1XH70_EUMVA|nr:hypothetical protein EVAR_26605_1 [Eumeta japonica]